MEMLGLKVPCFHMGMGETNSILCVCLISNEPRCHEAECMDPVLFQALATFLWVCLSYQVRTWISAFSNKHFLFKENVYHYTTIR